VIFGLRVNRPLIREKIAKPVAEYRTTDVAIISHPLELQVNILLIIVFSISFFWSVISKLSFRPNLAAC
jgi:hypothetical protein